MRKVVGIALAFGDIYDPTGEIIQPLDGSTVRFKTLAGIVKQGVFPFRIFCTAGYSKRSPLQAVPERATSLAEQITLYARGLMFDTSDLASIPLCWGTEGEIRKGIELAQTSFVEPGDEVELVIVSNWAHIPRIHLYCKKYLPDGWKLCLVPVDHDFSLWSHARELLACLVELFKWGKQEIME